MDNYPTLVYALKDVLNKKKIHDPIVAYRLFAFMDRDGNKFITREELSKGLRVLNIKFTDDDFKNLFEFFDRHRTGVIHLEDMITSSMFEMNKKRVMMVKEDFETFDVDKTGFISIADLKKSLSQKESNDSFYSILKRFEREDGDGKVNLDEYLRCFNTVSSTIANDADFEKFMKGLKK